MRRASAVLSLTALLLAPRVLHATTAAQLCLGNPCILARTVEVTPGSVLDFGARVFRMTGNGRLRIPEGDTLTITAGRVELQPGALIDQLTPANSRPATASITTTTGIQLQRSGATRARISLTSALGGGTISLKTDGNIDIDGDLVGRTTGEGANGGNLHIEAGGNVNIRGDVQLEGSRVDGVGGDVEIEAAGSILVAGSMDIVGGLQGGSVDISADRSLTITTSVDVSGSSASDGGDIRLAADGDIAINAALLATGPGTDLAGGTGGDIAIAAGGTLRVAGDLMVWGRGPEAQGGSIDLDAGIDILQTGEINAEGRGSDSTGGTIDLDAGRLLSLAGPSKLGGDAIGGDLTGEAEGEIQAKAIIDADGAEGGSITLDTTRALDGVAVVSGPITVSGNLHASGVTGGSVEVQGCDLTVAAIATLGSSGTEVPGVNRLLGTGLIRIAGALLAQVEGRNELHHPSNVPPILTGARIIPMEQKIPDPGLPACVPPPTPVCGNGNIEIGEACDDGNTVSCDGCSATCKKETCGDGVRDCPEVEVCDDGNLADGDGCDSNCTPTGCGNGVRTSPEGCDDGNRTPGDGCDVNCFIEPPPGCGDGVISEDLGEECDDHNTRAGDGCSAACRREECGNNVVDAHNPPGKAEQCDDGNTDPCDSCSPTCTFEICGNHIKDCGEDCDDGNMIDGDGCDSNCKFTGCGNGKVTAGEQCDDGNLADCDGCSATCQRICGNGLVDTQCGEQCDPSVDSGVPCSATCQTCSIGTPECPCAADTDCGPNGRCGGFACDQGLCDQVAIPQCSPADGCTGAEVCDPAACIPGGAPDSCCRPGPSLPCDDGNRCDGIETCVDGSCVSGAPLDCDDGDACTDDSCSPDECVHGTHPGAPGIDCEASAMIDALTKASPDDVTPSVRRKLQKLLGAIRLKAGQAIAASGNAKRQRKIMKVVKKQLTKLDQLIAKARKKHQLAPGLDASLTTARQSAGRALETFVAG